MWKYNIIIIVVNMEVGMCFIPPLNEFLPHILAEMTRINQCFDDISSLFTKSHNYTEASDTLKWPMSGENTWESVNEEGQRGSYSHSCQKVPSHFTRLIQPSTIQFVQPRWGPYLWTFSVVHTFMICKQYWYDFSRLLQHCGGFTTVRIYF